jgi:AcrR family transcriptional regulator
LKEPAVAKKSERQQHGSGRTRRRGAALEEALLDAVWAEFQEVGYPSLTVEAVADRAGTSRAVLYRRWRNRAEMVITAMRRHQPMLSGEVPDTGSLRGDVLALLTRVSAHLTEFGPETLYGILGDLFSDTESVAAFQDQVLHIGAGVMATILKHAEERGEVRQQISPRVASLPTDLFRHELLIHRAPPSKHVITEIVDDVFLPLVQRQENTLRNADAAGL